MKRTNRFLTLSTVVREFAELRERNADEEKRYWDRRLEHARKAKAAKMVKRSIYTNLPLLVGFSR